MYSLRVQKNKTYWNIFKDNMHIFANLWCFLIAHQGIWNHSNRYLGWQQFQASFAKLFFAAKRPYIFFGRVYVTIHILCSCVRHPTYSLFLCTSPFIFFVPVYVTLHILSSCVRHPTYTLFLCMSPYIFVVPVYVSQSFVCPTIMSIVRCVGTFVCL